MGILDSKDTIMDIVLTQHGRKLLGQGKFSPKFYRFGDEEVDYQAGIVPEWTPAYFGSDLVAWYDASDLDSIEMNSSNEVSLWRDKSGYGNHLNGYSSALPQYQTASLGSGNAMRGFGTDEYFWNTSMFLSGGLNSSYEFIFCGKSNSEVGTSTMYRYVDGEIKSAYLYKDDIDANGVKVFTLTVPDLNDKLYSYELTVTSSQLVRYNANAAGGDVNELYYNLNQVSSSNVTTNLLEGGDFTVFNHDIAAPSNTEDGLVGLILILRRSLRLDEHEKIYQYCQSKGWL